MVCLKVQQVLFPNGCFKKKKKNRKENRFPLNLFMTLGFLLFSMCPAHSRARPKASLRSPQSALSP